MSHAYITIVDTDNPMSPSGTDKTFKYGPGGASPTLSQMANAISAISKGKLPHSGRGAQLTRAQLLSIVCMKAIEDFELEHGWRKAPARKRITKAGPT